MLMISSVRIVSDSKENDTVVPCHIHVSYVEMNVPFCL